MEGMNPNWLPLDPDSLPGRRADQPPAGAGFSATTEHISARHHNHGCVDQPYPPAVAQAPSAQHARLVRNAYCGFDCSELSAVMQYFYHSMILRECAPQAAGEILGIAICEMHHLDLFATLLCSLGSDPKFFAPRRSARGVQNSWWSASPSVIDYADELGAALRADLESEKRTIAEYHRMAREITDPGIVRLLERILLDEENHLRIFTALLQRLCG